MTRWLLDLDNTLYPASSGLFHLVNEKISEYMAVRLNLPVADIPGLRRQYWQAYGLTLCGLMVHHGVDPEDYLTYVHDVPLERFLSPDAALAAALGDLPGEKFIFTNGSVGHARAVLRRLGVEGLISRIFDIAFMDYVPKPKPHGYRKLLEALAADPAETWMVDDVRENLDSARGLGMTTVLVGETGDEGHLHVRSVLELPDLLTRTLSEAGRAVVDTAPARRV